MQRFAPDLHEATITTYRFAFRLNQCLFHIQNPLSTTTGRNRNRTVLAAAGMAATGP